MSLSLLSVYITRCPFIVVVVVVVVIIVVVHQCLKVAYLGMDEADATHTGCIIIAQLMNACMLATCCTMGASPDIGSVALEMGAKDRANYMEFSPKSNPMARGKTLRTAPSLSSRSSNQSLLFRRPQCEGNAIIYPD